MKYEKKEERKKRLKKKRRNGKPFGSPIQGLSLVVLVCFLKDLFGSVNWASFSSTGKYFRHVFCNVSNIFT